MWKFTWPFIYKKLFLSDFTCFSCLAARPFVLSCDTSPPTVFQCLPTPVSTPAARAKHWEKLACVAPPLFPFLPIPYPLPLSTPATQARRNNRIIGKKWEWMLAHQHLMRMHITPCCTSLHARHIFLGQGSKYRTAGRRSWWPAKYFLARTNPNFGRSRYYNIYIYIFFA